MKKIFIFLFATFSIYGSTFCTNAIEYSNKNEISNVFINELKHPKTLGLKISVLYPRNWIAKPKSTIVPNNTINYSYVFSPLNSLDRACSIDIHDSGAELTQQKYKQIFSSMAVIQFRQAADNLKQGMNLTLSTARSKGDINILSLTETTIDDLPAITAIITTIIDDTKYNRKIFSKHIFMQTGYKNALITLECVANAFSKEQSEILYKQSLKDFTNFINSFKLLRKTEEQVIIRDTTKHTKNHDWFGYNRMLEQDPHTNKSGYFLGQVFGYFVLSLIIYLFIKKRGNYD